MAAGAPKVEMEFSFHANCNLSNPPAPTVNQKGARGQNYGLGPTRLQTSPAPQQHHLTRANQKLGTLTPRFGFGASWENKAFSGRAPPST